MRVLTPCPPQKGCLICESRLFQGERDPKRKAAKAYAQAQEAARGALLAISGRSPDLAYSLTRRPAGFVHLAERIAS